MHFNKLIPELSVVDLGRSLAFYVGVLRFQVEFERPADRFAFVAYQGSQLMLEQDNEQWLTAPAQYPRGRGVNFEIETDELEALAQRLRQHEVPLFREPSMARYATETTTEEVRELLVQDPDGYLQ